MTSYHYHSLFSDSLILKMTTSYIQQWTTKDSPDDKVFKDLMKHGVMHGKKL